MKIKIAFILLLALMHAPSLYAQNPDRDITVKVDGYGGSRSEALLRAKRNAVEQGIGVVLISQTEVDNFILKKDKVLTETMGSVRTVKILSEEKQSDGTFHVNVEAVVSLASIKADLAALKILLDSMDKPRMMVVIQEEDGNTAESIIVDYLSSKGFDLVDAAVVAKLLQKNDTVIRQVTAGDAVAAAEIGTSNGAEYIIIGKMSKSTRAGAIASQYNMSSGHANITAKVINCSNARVIASKVEQASVMHSSDQAAMAMASEKAATQLMDQKLFEKIVSSFQDMVNNGINIDITIKKVANFKMQKEVRNIFSGLPDMVSVSKRSFGGGQLKLSVQYKGSADSLSEAIDGITVEGRTLSVTDIVGNSVQSSF
jgi:hypothetical protein